MTTHSTKKLAAAALLALAGAALPAAAQSGNFGSWASYGDVLAAGSAATLTTASMLVDETTVSGKDALAYYEIEPALGVFLDADTFEGSAIAANFSALAGTRVDVSWALSSLEHTPGLADRAYVIVDGQVQTLAEIDLGAQSGLFSTTFASSGTHTLAFAVFDVNDYTGVTTLALSGLTVTAAVPEPATTALMLAGLGLVGAAARRRARQRP